jgi:histidinol-phosphate aminotransferase
MDVMERHPNVVVFRTFSKMYGLAGLRIGWLCGGHDVVQAVRRTCIVYSVNGPAQEAALAALHDEDHVRLTRELVGAGKGYLHRELKRLGLKTVCGEGNFMMIKAPMADTLAYRKLMRRGVMIRTMSGFRFPNWIRITIAEMDAMRAFIQAMEEALGPARGVKPSRSALHSRQGDS